MIPQCAKCPHVKCLDANIDDQLPESLPAFCPMRLSSDLVRSTSEKYTEDFRNLYIQSTINERNAYATVRGAVMGVRPRIKEIAEFANLMGISRVGIAFCAGLKDEAQRLNSFLEDCGLTVASVCCKCGGIDKTTLGLNEEHKIFHPGGFEAGCNPIIQADLLNNADTGFNIIVGLCVGHDMLFTMRSRSPVTTAIAKDRVLGHSPAIALYSSYHKRIIRDQKSL